MKHYFASKTLIALAVAIAAAAGYESLANEQPIPPPANGSALPDNIQSGSPVAQVVKLAQAGVDVTVIQTYISNCPSAFNLDADKIISLTDAGVPSDMVSAMIAHDKAFLASLPTSAPPVPAGAPAPASEPAASIASAGSDNSPAPSPPAEVTVNYFNDTLAPYGQWVEVAGYGRCWRPTTMVYNSTWQPYCDRGRWVYTDCGWYWNSDYAWGVTFHYGRWFNTPSYGWCWWPDTVWAPSWVTWRSSSDYCGWAPLPPYSVYQPGIGFTYYGNNVAVGFGFGLSASCYTFVSIGNFCQPHPRYYCAPPQQVTQIYNQTTIINNYNSHNHTIVNNGVPVSTIGAAAHHPIHPVSAGSLADGRQRGWQHGNPSGNTHSPIAGASIPTAGPNPGGAEFRHGPALRNDVNHVNSANNANADSRTGHRPPFNPPTQPAHVTPAAPPGNRQDLRPSGPSGFSGRNYNNQSQVAVAPATYPRHDAAGNGVSRNPNQITRPASSPVVAPVVPARPVASGSGSARDYSRPSAQAEVRVSPRQFSSSPVASSPPVVSQRPQQFESRPNIVAPSAPRSYSPPAPAMSAPAQNQYSAPAAGGSSGGRWMVQNH